MPPNTFENELANEEEIMEPVPKAGRWDYEIVYWNVIVFLYYHISGFYGLYLGFTMAKWPTIFLAAVTFILSGIGVVAGAHRLWSHKCYKAKRPLELVLMLFHSIANQHSVVHWARDHRLHHKYSDTNADPHNASRGFFYSHVGWLLVKKHPEVKRKGKNINVNDLLDNPFLSFQHRHNLWFIPLLAFVLPTIIPMYFWQETFSNSWHINMTRYITILNMTFSINSIAHLWGTKPYDVNISPGQNRVLFFTTFGEGAHNYHHVFPWDYRSDEFKCFNIATVFIDFCAFCGLAYDRKVVDKSLVKARALRTGDGSILYDEKMA